MAYDMGKDHEDFLHGANDFAHARMAKKLVDAKRAAKETPATDAGAMPSGETQDGMGTDAEPPGGSEGGLAEEPDGDEAIVPEGGAGGEKIPVEVTPEELAMIEKMRAGALEPAPPVAGEGAMDTALTVKRGGPPRL